jgi:hypothetical protein
MKGTNVLYFFSGFDEARDQVEPANKNQRITKGEGTIG